MRDKEGGEEARGREKVGFEVLCNITEVPSADLPIWVNAMSALKHNVDVLSEIR